MSESTNQFGFKLLVLLCCFPFQNVSGIRVKLTRDEDGDYFENPYATNAFCLSTNAICSDEHHGAQQDECSHCKCNTHAATFNGTHCVSFQDLQGECKTNLKDDFVKPLDLMEDGNTKLCTSSFRGKLKSVKIISMNSMSVKFFKGPKVESEEAPWEFELEWKDVPQEKYDGQVFKVKISYKFKKSNRNNRNDCFVFKSKGSIMVTIPVLTTTTVLPSETSLPSTTPLPSETPLPSTTPLPSETPLPSTTPLPGTNEKSTTQISTSHAIPLAIEDVTRTIPTIKPGSINKARNEESSIEGNNAVTVFLTVGGCLLLLVVVVLVVLFLRRRSARTSKEKKNAANPSRDRNSKNSMVMNSQPENIHPEEDSLINYPENGRDSDEYDYPDGNYASLDMTKVESRPVYQSLINVERDVNKQIPSKSGEISVAMPSGDGNIRNSMAMNSQLEYIYPETDSSINYPENGGDNHEHDYPDENYASLDMTKVESRPVYQSLINVERDVN